MTNIIFLTQRSAFVLLLLGSTYTHVFAATFYNDELPLESNSVKSYSHINDITQKLIDRGLNEEVAYKKAQNFFQEHPQAMLQLHKLYNNQILDISKEKLQEKILHYVLFNKNVDFTSYTTLAELVQSTQLMPLSKKQHDILRIMAA